MKKSDSQVIRKLEKENRDLNKKLDTVLEYIQEQKEKDKKERSKFKTSKSNLLPDLQKQLKKEITLSSDEKYIIHFGLYLITLLLSLPIFRTELHVGFRSLLVFFIIPSIISTVLGYIMKIQLQHKRKDRVLKDYHLNNLLGCDKNGNIDIAEKDKNKILNILRENPKVYIKTDNLIENNYS